LRSRKIHIALKNLNVYELNSFRKYLCSPYFNQQELFVKYFDLINDFIRAQKDPDDMEAEYIWEHITEGGEAYDDQRFRKYCSDIYKHFENFMAQKYFEDDINLKNNLKFRAIRNKGIGSLYPTLVKQAEIHKSIDKNRNAEYYLNQFNIERNILAFKSDMGKDSRKIDLAERLNLEEISFNLDVFFIAEKLKYYCTYLSWSRSYKLEKKLTGIEIILRLAEMDQFKDHPPVAVYLTISKTITEADNTEHYYHLKELIKKYLHFFPDQEALEILQEAISYCVIKMNKGQKEFELESFELYKKALDSDLIVIDGKMSATTYRNIAVNGMRVGEFEWVENFIEEYSNYLPESQKDSNRNFSLARLEFYRKDFNKIIELLRDIKFDNIFISLNSRIMLVIAYFELYEDDALDSLLQSFRVYVEREKALNKQFKTQYINFIKFVKRLSSIQYMGNSKLIILKEKLEESKQVANKDWILEKINERIKKR
jgi:hypothetical protein